MTHDLDGPTVRLARDTFTERRREMTNDGLMDESSCYDV
jgi:hypothetical protein